MRSHVLAVTTAAMLCTATAHAAPITYGATLSGPAEAPPVPSPGTGSTIVTYDPATHMLRVEAEFAGLLAPTTAAHIHLPTPVPFEGTAGVATQTPSFVGFPLGVTAGTFDNTFDLMLPSNWNPAFVTASGGSTALAEARLAVALENGTSYLNIHSAAFPGGEIRGFLTPVPEPAALTLMTAALGIVLVRRSRRRA